MNSQFLVEELETLVSAPSGMYMFRNIILDLALSGKLSEEKIEFKPKLLGDITNIKTGKLDANASSENGAYPFFTCAKDPLRISTYTYDTECVLLAGNGNFDVNYYSGKFDAYQRTYILEPKSREMLFVPFLYRYMQSQSRKLKEQSIGGVIKYLKIGFLTSAPILLPSISDQKSIVALIESLMSLCDELENKINHRESIRRSVQSSSIEAISTAQTQEEFDSAWNRIQQNWDVISGNSWGIDSLRGLILDLAVTGRLVRSSTGSRQSVMRERHLSETSWGKFAPPEWNLTTLGDACLKISDGTHKTPNYKETGVPFLSIKDISGGKIDFCNTRYISQAEHDELCKRIKPSRGDVLFCRIGTLGRAITVDTDQEFSIFVSLGLLRPKPVLNPKYLEIALNSPISHKQFDSIKAGGSHTQKLNLAAMSKYIIWYPDLDTQNEIVDRVTSLKKLCDKIEFKLKEKEKIANKFSQSVVSA